MPQSASAVLLAHAQALCDHHFHAECILAVARRPHLVQHAGRSSPCFPCCCDAIWAWPSCGQRKPGDPDSCCTNDARQPLRRADESSWGSGGRSMSPASEPRVLHCERTGLHTAVPFPPCNCSSSLFRCQYQLFNRSRRYQNGWAIQKESSGPFYFSRLSASENQLLPFAQCSRRDPSCGEWLLPAPQNTVPGRIDGHEGSRQLVLQHQSWYQIRTECRGFCPTL